WLDVRLPSEHQTLTIEGALNVPLYLIRLKLSMLDRKTPYVVYCDTGRRSSAAAYILVERGFDAYVLTGGVSGSEGLQLVRGGALALIALRALGRHPDDPPGHGELLVLAHEVQQHEHLIAQTVIAVGGNEQPAVLHERHVGKIQGALVLDGEGQQTRFVPHSHFRPHGARVRARVA